MHKITKSNIASLDSEQMWDLLEGFPNQWNEAVNMTQSLDLNINPERINKICLAGMGGSAIGADLIRAYSYRHCPHPVQVVRHYDAPAWIDEQTLFITCSFSGNTEETLSAASQARKNGAQMVAVTSGGELMVNATEHDFDYINIPGGMPPRAALGYSFVPLFRIFQHMGYLDEGDGALAGNR